MRGLATEAVASFVAVLTGPDAAHPAAIAGCDERTYYAATADAATIATSRAAGEVVQLHRGEPGGPPQAAAIMCIIDGSGSN